MTICVTILGSVGLLVGVYMVFKDRSHWKQATWIMCCSLVVVGGGSIPIDKVLSVSDSFNYSKEIADLTNQMANLDLKMMQAVELKQEISQNVTVINEVRQEITNIYEAIRSIYAKRRIRLFHPDKPRKLCGIAKNGNNGSVVGLLLDECPVTQSVSAIQDNRPLYPTSMRFNNNLVLIAFTSPEAPTNSLFSVDYLADDKNTNTFRRIENKGNVIYVDGIPVVSEQLP